MDHVLARRASAHFREVWWWSRDSWSHGPLCSQKGLKARERSTSEIGESGVPSTCASRHCECRNRDE
jgi:hypothetical protein